MADTPKKRAPRKSARKKAAKKPAGELETPAFRTAEITNVPAVEPGAARDLGVTFGLLAASEPVQADFGEFFKTVGTGLVAAQEQMDAASVEYLKGISGKSHLLPSVFRIPRVTAEMKFALTKGVKEKFDILIFGKDTLAETMHQQSVHFEVVSAPPPVPGLLPPYGYDPVLADDRRKRVFDAIRAIPNAATTFADLLRDPLDRVLILVNQTENQYLLMRAGDAAGQLGLWYLIMQPDTAPTVATLRPFGGAADPALDQARGALSQAGRAQADFLTRLGS
jgi:hypothetical protein